MLVWLLRCLSWALRVFAQGGACVCRSFHFCGCCASARYVWASPAFFRGFCCGRLRDPGVLARVAAWQLGGLVRAAQDTFSQVPLRQILFGRSWQRRPGFAAQAFHFSFFLAQVGCPRVARMGRLRVAHAVLHPVNFFVNFFPFYFKDLKKSTYKIHRQHPRTAMQKTSRTALQKMHGAKQTSRKALQKIHGNGCWEPSEAHCGKV